MSSPAPPIAFPSRRSHPCSRPCPPVPRRRPAGSCAALAALVLVLRRLHRQRRLLAGGRRSSTAIATAAPTATPAADAASPTPAPAFPATLTDDEGTGVTLAAEPQKIVSLTPATTEILFALGAGDRGRRDDDATTTRAAADPARRRDLHVGRRREDRRPRRRPRHRRRQLGFNPPDAITKLRDLGVPVLVVYAPDRSTACSSDIELIGAAVGATDEARTMTDAHAAPACRSPSHGRGDRRGCRSRASSTSSATPTRPARSTPPADKSFLAEMITLAGGEPITTGSTNDLRDPAREAHRTRIRR